MFDSLLIANRGEIACRVIRSARRLGLRSIAVCSEADRKAQHVLQADEAHVIGTAPAAESYLRVPAIIAAAEASGAAAIHPGYGFLAENAAFAEACAAAGLVFVGPPAAAIRAMGSKREAKAIMARAGVPLVPGYHEDDQTPDALAAAAKAIGYPVLIKASAGGGGKGMRIVEKAADFAAALAGAQREAKAAFGDDSVLLERYLQRPRHIEVQVFADGHGQVVHLFDRDCSIQRRHQKVVEEAPAPGLSDEMRGQMAEAAMAAARAIDYRGAGTIEFIVEDDVFYFMEMNTRLQVEHPVTELVTGQDLVEWQLRVAAGEPLPLDQASLATRGHAVEVRLYAEDPARDFLPATGRLSHLRFPDASSTVRVDTGVTAGDAVSVHYDPMIAKLVTWGEDRAATLRHLRRALAATEIAGVTTNLAFLTRVAAHPAYQAGELDTGFLARHAADLQDDGAASDDTVVALAALATLERMRQEATAAAARSNDPHSPWHRTDGWRLNAVGGSLLRFLDGSREFEVPVIYGDEHYSLGLPSGPATAQATTMEDGRLDARIDGQRVTARVLQEAGRLTVIRDGVSHGLLLHDPLAAAAAAEGGGGHLFAPMPGKVVAVQVAAGAAVAAGQPILVLEAMKMEHTILAPADGKVTALHYAAGDLVEEGAELVVFEATAQS